MTSKVPVKNHREYKFFYTKNEQLYRTLNEKNITKIKGLNTIRKCKEQTLR